MNFIFETLIIIGISVLFVFFAALICFRDEHFYIKHEGVEKKHYILKKLRFLFLPAYAVTWNWKTGIIRKSTLWGLFGLYMYFLCFYIFDLIYYFLTVRNFVLSQPIIFVVLAVFVPLISILVFGFVKLSVQRKNNEDIVGDDIYSLSKRARDGIAKRMENDDTDDEIK